MSRTFLATLVLVSCALTAWAQDTSQHSTIPHRNVPISTASTPRTLEEVLTVPENTEVSVEMLSGIHTQINHLDDPITAQVLQPVFVNGQLALPSGSLVDGHIRLVRPSRRLHRPAELGLRFDRIVLPNGEQKPFAAVLAAVDKAPGSSFHLDPEGRLVGARPQAWKWCFGGFAGLGAVGMIRAALVGPAAVSSVVPWAGATLLGLEVLWPRGREVNLPPQTHCRLRLSAPLTLRVPW